MTNVSGLLIHVDPSPERLTQAKEWTSKGIEIADKARNELAQSASRAKDPECEHAWAVLLYNLGAVLEVCGGAMLDVAKLICFTDGK